MQDGELIEAIKLIKSNNKNEAITTLTNIIRTNPKNEDAWLWLSVCMSEFTKKRYCLQKVLEINPNNENAKIALTKIGIPQSPTVEEIINPERIEPKNITKKRSGFITCLLSALILSLFAIIGIIIFLFSFLFIPTTDSSISGIVYYLYITNNICRYYHPEFSAQNASSLGENRYQAEGQGYKCTIKIHPEILSDDEKNNDVSASALMLTYGEAYGELESYEPTIDKSKIFPLICIIAIVGVIIFVIIIKILSSSNSRNIDKEKNT